MAHREKKMRIVATTDEGQTVMVEPTTASFVDQPHSTVSVAEQVRSTDKGHKADLAQGFSRPGKKK